MPIIHPENPKRYRRQNPEIVRPSKPIEPEPIEPEPKPVRLAGGLILTHLYEAETNMLSRKKLWTVMWRECPDERVFDRAIVAMQKAGMIDELEMKDGVSYQLTKRMLEKMR